MYPDSTVSIGSRTTVHSTLEAAARSVATFDLPSSVVGRTLPPYRCLASNSRAMVAIKYSEAAFWFRTYAIWTPPLDRNAITFCANSLGGHCTRSQCEWFAARMAARQVALR